MWQGGVHQGSQVLGRPGQPSYGAELGCIKVSTCPGNDAYVLGMTLNSSVVSWVRR